MPVKRRQLETFRRSPGLPGGLSLLNSWIQVCKRYLVQVDDEPWGYTERPQVGFLAQAAWNVGGVALVEWQTDKRHVGSDKRMVEVTSG